jgi:peptidoglycan-N-acetylglucosamine deacetylase
VINALCVDLEPWYSAEIVKKYLPENYHTEDDQVIESTSLILKLLDKFNAKATFAVLGIVAEKYPELIKDIHKKGHEIASHAYSHKTLYELGEIEFEKEIIKSINLIESIIGVKPTGFRAPSFSLNNSTIWALNILVKYHFKYDASVFPIKTNLYGVPNAPSRIYKPSLIDIAKEDLSGNIVEFPMPCLKLGINFPVTGGFYLRSLPLAYQKYAIKIINRTRPVILYIHPWEVNPQVPKLKNMPLFPRLITYYGINSSLNKIELLLKSFQFVPIYTVLNTYQAAKI